MKLTFYLYLIIVVFVFGIFAFTNSVFAQNEENHSSIVTITGIGLDLTKQALLTNNYNVAEKYSTMTNNFYGKNIQFLRSYNSALSDDIHIELLDLHSSILSKSDSETLINQINKIQELFSQIPFNGNSNILASSILSEADEQYQLAIQQNNLESYFFTQSLVEHSKNTVKQNPSNNDRLNQELDSFFKDLDESISKKQDFTIVGSLITAIQRDLLQTETIDSNKKIPMIKLELYILNYPLL